MKKSERNISNLFTPEVLSEKEMSLVIGGKRRKPKTRDKDIYEFEEADFRKKQ